MQREPERLTDVHVFRVWRSWCFVKLWWDEGNSPNSLQDKTDHLNNIFIRKNNYNADFVRRNTHSNANSNTRTNINYLCPCYDCLLLTEDKDGPEDRQGAVYKIKCCDCQTTNIGETGGNLSTRLPEHKQATRNGQWCLQSHCWAPFTDKTSNWLAMGLCDMHEIFYRLLPTTL